jgi:hypothetical protein
MVIPVNAPHVASGHAATAQEKNLQRVARPSTRATCYPGRVERLGQPVHADRGGGGDLRCFLSRSPGPVPLTAPPKADDERLAEERRPRLANLSRPASG